MNKPFASHGKIRILIAEHSATASEALVAILRSDPRIEVVGTVRNGREAVEAAIKYHPDLITMDVNMPVLDGIEATKEIMRTAPVPIVMVSSVCDEDVSTTFTAMEAGALAVVRRPAGLGHPSHALGVAGLLRMVKAMAEVKVVRRWAGKSTASRETASLPDKAGTGSVRAVAIGASTGGPAALADFLGQLPSTFPAPVLIVQHISPGFTAGFVDWLASSSKFPVELAEDGAALKRGRAYVAPDGWQMGLCDSGRIKLSKDSLYRVHQPSVGHLFASVAQVFGADSIGVLLTGMGDDGAIELRELKMLGALTFAQDQESSVVYGMPQAAARLSAAGWTGSPAQIAKVVARSINNRLQSS